MTCLLTFKTHCSSTIALGTRFQHSIMMSDDLFVLLIAVASCLFGLAMGVLLSVCAVKKLGLATRSAFIKDLKLESVFLTHYGKAPHRKNNCGGAKDPQTCYASKPLLRLLPFPKCCKTE